MSRSTRCPEFLANHGDARTALDIKKCCPTIVVTPILVQK